MIDPLAEFESVFSGLMDTNIMGQKISYQFRKLFSYILEFLKNKKYRSFLFGGLIILSLLFIFRATLSNWDELSEQIREIDYRYLISSIILSSFQKI